jgi:hypothetical protein
MTVYHDPPVGSEVQFAQATDNRGLTPTAPLYVECRGPAGEVPPDVAVHVEYVARGPTGVVTYSNDRWLELP